MCSSSLLSPSSINCAPLCQRIWRPAATSAALCAVGALDCGIWLMGGLARMRLGGTAGSEAVDETEARSGSGCNGTSAPVSGGVGADGNIAVAPMVTSSAGLGEAEPRHPQELAGGTAVEARAAGGAGGAAGLRLLPFEFPLPLGEGFPDLPEQKRRVGCASLGRPQTKHSVG
eukprot:6492527-Amphidinium_carterae.2